MMHLAQVVFVVLFVLSIYSRTEGDVDDTPIYWSRSFFVHSFYTGAAEIGNLPNLQHGVRGTLFALDETTFFIRNFEYDGLGPSKFYMYIYFKCCFKPALVVCG